MKDSLNGRAGIAGLATALAVAAGFLVAAPSPSSATLAERESCYAVVGGNHCCKCGNDSGSWYCEEVANNAAARCNDSAGVCEGNCAGSVE